MKYISVEFLEKMLADHDKYMQENGNYPEDDAFFVMALEKVVAFVKSGEKEKDCNHDWKYFEEVQKSCVEIP